MAQKSTVAVIVLLLVTLVAPPAVEAQDGILSNILRRGLLNIGGTIYCTLNGAIGVNGTATPVFSNALVQLQCGSGNIVAAATTNANGVFSILLNPLQFVLSTLLQNCKLVVPTPLSTCNSALPDVGGLVSLLRSIGRIVVGLLRIDRLIPAGFGFFSVL
ncbi:phylloplanin-like [Heracleum sosnowskyi]|uniref:Phylloplanin-like n=1 Tax=Heracleum sosnowskyi TaxID=360622 RepID=A0AAD8I9C2_9APIA|nr:phylloplanin-like [Heracleum sosnowskyi]